jgi:hypothetical protein
MLFLEFDLCMRIRFRLNYQGKDAGVMSGTINEVNGNGKWQECNKGVHQAPMVMV